MLFSRRSLFLSCIGCLCFVALAQADQPARTSLFDPAHYMRVSEVRPGMTGYGVSVFSGTQTQRFDVEVVSVLKNFNPKDDVILIRCHGANLEHTGSIAGMSGSPIYLKDDQGNDRMIGAFAYGWPLAKDPIAGVQPIQYMLDLPDLPANAATEPTTQSSEALKTPDEATEPHPHIHWNLGDCIPLPGMKHMPPGYPLISADRFEPSENLAPAATDSMRMQPLATPLMTSGMPAKMLEQFAPMFRAYGLSPLQAGGSGGYDSSIAAGPGPTTQPPLMFPGSVLVAPLVTGDVDMTAVGTCTDVVGDRVFGFGHPFNNEGPINLPFAAGEIHAIIANLQESFKLGSMTKMMGTLTTDQSVGVAGHLGAVPALIPMDIRILYTDGSLDQTYHFNCVRHPKFTPLLTVAALTAVITGSRDLPQYHTLDYDLNLDFVNGRSLKIANAIVDDNPAVLFLQVAAPMMAASENPFERVLPTKLSGTIRVTPESKQADILSVNVPKLTYKPGETVKAYVQYRPFRAGEATLPIEFQLPRDLPDGTYPMVISGWEQYLTDEQAARPFRFNANNMSEVFDVLQDFLSVRHDAVYARLVRQADGVALGRSALPRLPSSIRQVMLDAGRSDTTAYISSEVRIFPSPLVMDGSADFAVTIQAAGHGEANRQPHPEMPQPPPQPGGEKPRKSDVPVEPGPPK
jgi:hypothetical protein